MSECVNPKRHTKQEMLSYPAGVKWTKQRKSVYRVLSDATEPLSAQQIYLLVEEENPEEAYALSTIYRILAAFEEKGLINSTTWMGEDKVVYELERGGHTHYAVCLECHKRIPLHSCPFSFGHGGHRHDDAEEELEDFTVVGHKVELYGYCSQCRTKQDNCNKKCEN